MKRFLVTILSLLYMASATGATVHIHYCMGKLMSASLTDREEDGCGKCCAKKKAVGKDCCKDEQKTIKVGDHQLAKIVFDGSHGMYAILPAPQSHYISTIASSPRLTTAFAHAPPSLWRTCPIYIQLQNFRI